MDRVTAAAVFNRICELGSLSAASRSLGISRPMVSRYLEEMEKWAGTRLLHRSSRQLTLTPAGEAILQKTRQLALISEAIQQETTQGVPAGTLRIACAHFTALHLVGPVITDFLARYPALRIELEINNQPVSLIGERIDLAIRITDSPEPGAIARRLGECHSVLCASPEYLKARGNPETRTIWLSIIASTTVALPDRAGILRRLAGRKSRLPSEEISVRVSPHCCVTRR